MEGMVDFETVRAAVSGEKWAIEKVVEHYSEEIDRMATVKKRLPNGKVKQVINEDLRQRLTLKLIESIPLFPMEDCLKGADCSGDEKP